MSQLTKVPHTDQEVFRDHKLAVLVNMRQNIKSNFKQVSQEWANAGHQSDCSAKQLNYAIYHAVIHGKYSMNISQGITVLNAIKQCGFRLLAKAADKNIALARLQFLYRCTANNIITTSKNKNMKIAKASHSLDTSIGYEFGIGNKNINNHYLYLAPKNQAPQLITQKDLEVELDNLIKVLKKLKEGNN